jgi:hypothetical protein
VGCKKPVAGAQEATRHERPIGVLQQRDASLDLPTDPYREWLERVDDAVKAAFGD